MKTMARLLGLCGLLAVSMGSALAQPVELFFKRAAVREVELSPSGRQLAFTAARGEQRVGLYVRELDSGETRALAVFSDIDVVAPRWVGEERLLFSTADLGDQAVGSSYGWPGLFAVAANGGRPRELIQRRSYVINENLGGTRSDGALDVRHRLLAQPVGEGDEVVVGRFEGNFVNDLERVELLWLNTRTATTRRYADDVPKNVQRWVFDPRGEARAALTRSEGVERLLWRGPGDSAWRQIAEGRTLGFQPAFVDAIGTLFVTQSRGTAGESVLLRFDVERGRPQEQALAALPGFDFRGRLLFAEDGVALGLRLSGELERTVWFLPALQQLQQQAEARFPGRSVRIDCRRCGQADMSALVFAHADRDPGQYWLYRAKSGGWQGLARVREGVEPAAMASVEFRRISARDGRPLPLWITKPAQAKAGEPLPTLVLAHGGPWVRGGHWRWEALEQFLASRGYLVLQPEFRGSDGFGRAHLRAGDRQWGLAMQDDLADALAWAQREGLASREACILGASYGGYATLMGLIRHPEQYRCGAAWVAVSDPFLYLQGSVWVDDDISQQGRRHQLPLWVGDVEKDAERLRAASPVLRAAEIKAPLLLAYGGRDLRVPLAHGERLRAAMRTAGLEPEWKVYEDEGHGWFSVANQVDFAQRLEAFFARNLKPAPR